MNFPLWLKGLAPPEVQQQRTVKTGVAHPLGVRWAGVMKTQFKTQ